MPFQAIEPGPSVYPTGGDYLHAAAISDFERVVYVAGTMGLRPDGQAGCDLDEQLQLIWTNVGHILNAAGMSVDNIVRVTSYLTARDQMEANMSARIKALNGRIVPTTAIVVTTLSDEWLVEIEVIAAL